MRLRVGGARWALTSGSAMGVNGTKEGEGTRLLQHWQSWPRRSFAHGPAACLLLFLCRTGTVVFLWHIQCGKHFSHILLFNPHASSEGAMITPFYT